MPSNRQPIVITGLGLVTALGASPDETWHGVLNKRSGLGPMPALERPTPDDKGGFQAVDLPADYEPALPREARYLHFAIRQALNDAGAVAPPYAAHRCGFAIGTTLHGMRSGGEFLRSGDYSHLSSFLAGSTMQLATAGLPFSGDAVTTCSACSSSLGSVALAVTLLQSGELDLVVAGGYDAVSEYAYAGFNSLRVVADGPLQPFARDRRGMKLGEGYAIVVLERQDAAVIRNARIHATVLGWGESADAHHLTQPHPQGRGAAEAMSAALRRANLQPGDVNLIAAHATGTPDNDTGEHAAMAVTFGPHLPAVPVVALKSHLGHTLGGAGAAELILSALALRDQLVPPTASTKSEEIEFDDLSINTALPKPAMIDVTLNTSLGFGGANTCVALGRAGASMSSTSVSASTHDVCITGIGLVLPTGIGIEALSRPMNRDAGDTGPISEEFYLHLLNARRVRRMSEYVKLSLAATVLALRHAGVEWPGEFTDGCSVLLGSTHGGTQYCYDYYRQIVDGGWIAANPMLFAEGVPNAAAAHLSLMLSLKGACQTVIGSRTAGLDALRLASLRVATGEWDQAIVGAAEEYSTVVNEGYRQCGLYGGSNLSSGFATGSGAVTLLLESRESVRKRGGTVFGRVTATGSRRLGEQPVESIANLLDAIGPGPVIGSGNGTWVDRAEAAAARRAGDRAMLRPVENLPELFSVGPLAQAAAAVTRGDAAFNVLCTGYTGTATAAHFER